MKTIIILSTFLVLTGCATNYDQYAQAQLKIAEANAISAKYRYEALTLMGNSGGDAAKVAAIMQINATNTEHSTQVIQPPKSWQDQALQWASVLLPSITQVYSIKANKATSLAQIDASTKTSANQIGGFVEFGRLIKDPTIVMQPAPLTVNQPTPIIVKPEVVFSTIPTN